MISDLLRPKCRIAQRPSKKAHVVRPYKCTLYRGVALRNFNGVVHQVKVIEPVDYVKYKYSETR